MPRPRKKHRGRPPKSVAGAGMKCEKCGRNKFPGKRSFAAHKRYCKGALAAVAARATVVKPTLKDNAFKGESLLQAMAKAPNGQNPIEKLRQLAAGKRQEAAEIDRLVEEFEAKAEKLLG